MAADNSITPPKYRFFTTDLMTNEVLMEIPFRNVSWERALKSAGAFNGSIPVIDKTRNLNLYENTMPGQTGLYVVRNNECVWGGIIWSRSYGVKDNDLKVSASEFTSYFHHRLIWKTVNYQYGAHVVVSGGQCSVVFDGSQETSALKVGASVKVDFYEPENFRYNGYYEVAGTPPPTTTSFFTTLSAAVANITAYSRADAATLTLYTDAAHGFTTGDAVTITGVPGFNGTYAITADAGSESQYFTIPYTGPNISKTTLATPGLATRPVPDGVYENVTITVRADTYDYIRGLVGSVFDDFMGIDFPNDYLTPGIGTDHNITSKRLSQNYATITTADPHNLAVGQSVQIDNVGAPFDGEYEVTDTPDDSTFMYVQSGTLGTTPVVPLKATVVARSAADYVATLTTSSPHGYSVGQRVSVNAGSDMDSLAAMFSGDWVISAVPTPTTFSYQILSSTVAPRRALTQPSVIRTAGTGNSPVPIYSRSYSASTGRVTITTTVPHNFVEGGLVRVSNVDITAPIAEKALDAPNKKATITTSVPHQLLTGDSVTIDGLQDVSTPTTVTISGGTSGTMNNRINTVVDSRGFGSSNQYFTTAYTSTPTYVSGTGATVTMTQTRPPLTVGWGVGNQAVVPNAPIGSLTPGKLYTYSAEVYAPGMGAQLTLNIDGDGSTPPTIVKGVDVNDIEASKTGFVRQSLTFVAPAVSDKNAGVIVPLYILNATLSPSSGGSITWRNAQVEEGDTAGTIFYIGYPATTPFTYVSVAGPNGNVAVERASGVTNATVTMATQTAHNFSIGNTLTISDLADTYTVKTRAISNSTATITLSSSHNIVPGQTISVSDVIDSRSVTSRVIKSGVATFSLNTAHAWAVNDKITVAGMNETASVVSKEIVNGIMILTTNTNHNIQPSQQINVKGVGAPFDSVSGTTTVVLSTTPTRILYQVDAALLSSYSKKLKVKYTTPNKVNVAPTKASGTITSTDSVLNGNFVVSDVPSNTQVSVTVDANDVPSRNVTSVGVAMTGLSPVNGVYTVSTANPSTGVITYPVARPNLASQSVPQPADGKTAPPTVSGTSILNGPHQITAVSRNTFSFKEDVFSLVTQRSTSGGYASVPSIFNGVRAVTGTPSAKQFTFTMTAANNVLETVTDLSAYVRVPNFFNGTASVYSVDNTTNSFTYMRTRSSDVSLSTLSGYGSSVVRPVAVTSTYGSFPGNSNIDIGFSTRNYSGKNVEPTAFRGYALSNAGEALDTYSSTTDGFDYRIDCAYDTATGKFTRTFVLIPIDFPNPPPAGEASPPSRFGADKLVFEYPRGSIIDVKMDESSENAATRFFAVGNANLGEGAADPYSAASSEALLNGENSRRWPILDGSESVSDVTDEAVLYTYAAQYLNEDRPPVADFTVEVYGSIQPEVRTYKPGDWCSIIVNDQFLLDRLASAMEPRDTVIVRKIDSYKVSVPDDNTFPETVSLSLIAEWNVDKLS